MFRENLKLCELCDTELHTQKKGELPPEACLIQLKVEDKGYDNIVLPIKNLEKDFIRELMANNMYFVFGIT